MSKLERIRKRVEEINKECEAIKAEGDAAHAESERLRCLQEEDESINTLQRYIDQLEYETRVNKEGSERVKILNEEYGIIKRELEHEVRRMEDVRLRLQMKTRGGDA